MEYRYRIIKFAEDGQYVLRDNIESITKAEYIACRLNEDGGDGGLRVYVEQYIPEYFQVLQH